MASFNPCRLDPVASINRALLDGREARSLLSAAALRELAADAGVDATDAPIRTALNSWAGTPEFGVVADRYAARLSRLLVALRSGQRDVRPEWDDTWWEQWAAVTTLWLGGGLIEGAFGAAIAERLDLPDVHVQIPAEAARLPLAGAARLALSDPVREWALVLDFGHTSVKRAVATADRLVELPSVRAPAEDADGAAVATVMLDILAAAWAEAGRPPGPVVCAIAAYTQEGQPLRTRLGTYTRLADVTDDVQEWFSERLGTRVVLLHDGTAAAHAVPPDPRSVVLLLGTSLGVGFPAST